MNRFIKDNLVLFIVLGCTLLAAVILLVFSLIGYARMYGYHKQAADLRAQIEDLIKQKPAPVLGNVEPMNQEIKFYQQKNAELTPHFGRIKTSSLEAFTKTLGADPEKFREIFRAAWESDEDRKAQGGRQRFYQRFMRGRILEHDWYKAVKLTERERQQMWSQAQRVFFEKYGSKVSANAELDILFGEFAKPKHADAVAEFCYKLEVDKDAFLKIVAEAQETIKDPKASGAQQLFRKQFIAGEIPEKDWAGLVHPSDAVRTGRWQRALQAFRQAYQKLTIEPVNEGNQDEILLSVLGVPRNYDGRGDWCMQNFMVPMRGWMLELCANPPQKKEAKPKTGKEAADNAVPDLPSKLELLGDAGSFGFNYKQDPQADQIANVVKNWEIVGDLVTRIIHEGLFALNSFHIRSLAGTKAGRYTVYHYTFGVSGEISAIRALVKNLNAAARENRMYVINSIFLYADQDGASEIFMERRQEAMQKRQELESGPAKEENNAGSSAAEPGNRRPEMPDAPPGMNEQTKPTKTPAQIRAEEMKKPYNERTGYGRLLFGGTQNCEAVFDVDYVFIEDPELN